MAIELCGAFVNPRRSNEPCIRCEGTGEVYEPKFDEGDVDIVDTSRATCPCCKGRGLHQTASAESFSRDDVRRGRATNDDIFQRAPAVLA